MKNEVLSKNITLNLNIQEINMVIKALGQFPYNQVNELITKIHQQAGPQLNHTNGHGEKQTAEVKSNQE